MKSTKHNLTQLSLAVMTAVALTTSGNAAPVTFDNSVAIANPSALDAPLVFSGATLLQSVNFGSGAQTVNTPGLQTINFAAGTIDGGAASGTATTLFRAGSENNAGLFSGDTGDASFNAVLQGQGWANSGSSASPETLRIGGLTDGDLYVVELLASDMRAGSAGRTQQYHDTMDFTGNASDSFSVQTPTYVLGYFTADVNGFQDIFIKDTRVSGWDTTFAGFTLYSATSVPEPTSAAMLGLGGLASLMIYRRRRN